MQDRFEHFFKVLMNAEPDDIVTSEDFGCEDTERRLILPRELLMCTAPKIT